MKTSTRPSSSSQISRRLRTVMVALALLPGWPLRLAVAQQNTARPLHTLSIVGEVLDPAGKQVGEASVKLERKDAPGTVESQTTGPGVFAFSGLSAGVYLLTAQKSELRSHPITVTLSASGNQQRISLVLHPDAHSSAPAMEFADQPNFTVAGVTDWTAVGGHGSDSTLRTSEALARETATLKPLASTPATAGEAKESESRLRASLAGAPGSFEANHRLGEFYRHAGNDRESIPLLQAAYLIDPANRGNEYDLAQALEASGDPAAARGHLQNLLARPGNAHPNNADLHRSLGELDEKIGDPLAAVREEEQAVRLDPSEQNYFAWGSELLLHRAVWQAAEVLKNGSKAHPKSARMLAALGTAQFAGALYDEAAVSLCQASDLTPADPETYAFLGRIEMAAPNPLACVEPKLARFLRQQPASSLANYLYAMAIWKRQQQPLDVQALRQTQTLLTKAVAIDPKYGDAYLRLGIIAAYQHHLDQAIRLYTKAIEVDPQLAEAHYRLGVAYDRMGAPEKATQQFQLHDEIEKQQAATVERQRREVKQFLVVLEGQPAHPPPQ